LMHVHHSWREVACDPVRAELFKRIHCGMKGHEFEEEFWSDLLSASPTPPPLPVVRDLIARDIEVVLIGHFLLPDSILWDLAERVDESLLTLGKRRYINDEFSADQFEEVLYAFPTHHWLLKSLTYEEPSDNEKVARLVSYISRLPDASKLVKGSPEAFARIWRDAR